MSFDSKLLLESSWWISDYVMLCLYLAPTEQKNMFWKTDFFREHFFPQYMFSVFSFDFLAKHYTGSFAFGNFEEVAAIAFRKSSLCL